jgi:cyclopropane fatty-acyl-phospholipid synthase-like methyltransferase
MTENIGELLKNLGSKPSESEENGLALIRPTDLIVFSPGISTGGIAEIRMALGNRDRKVIATTIDDKGLEYAAKNISELGLGQQIDARLEDLRKDFPYPESSFDFIYARLVLHYLSFQDLDKVLKRFRESLKPSGELFVVVRSVKNLTRSGKNAKYDPATHLTEVVYRDDDGKVVGRSSRYFHTPESITSHLKGAGFEIKNVKEYQEQLYKDFMRTKVAPNKDHLIEVLAK